MVTTLLSAKKYAVALQHCRRNQYRTLQALAVASPEMFDRTGRQALGFRARLDVPWSNPGETKCGFSQSRNLVLRTGHLGLGPELRPKFYILQR